MSDTNIIIKLDRYGALPIDLRKGDPTSLIFLSGGASDFCVAKEQTKPPLEYYSEAWSSNSSKYIVQNSDEIVIYDSISQKNENIGLEKINNNTDKFFSYITKNISSKEKTIKNYIMNKFNKIRNEVVHKVGNTAQSDLISLQNLFKLLLILDKDMQININCEYTIESFGEISNEFLEGYEGRTMYLDLILRHTAGVLFWEAQNEINFLNPSETLFGTVYFGEGEKNYKKYSGIHYTPQYLSRSIVENSLKALDLTKTDELKIFDPACGSGEFFVETLKQIDTLNFSGNLNINGRDIEKTAIETSNFILGYEKEKNWKKKLSYNIIQNDSLIKEWDNDYDLILMNPPYQSWEQLSKEQRECISEIVGSSSSRPNMVSAFLKKSLNAVKEGGVIGCVVPSSIFTMLSYKKLREEISEEFNVVLLGKLGNFIFENALTDVSMLIIQKPKKNDYESTILRTKNEKEVGKDALIELRKRQKQEIVDNSDISIYHEKYFPKTDQSRKVLSLPEKNIVKSLSNKKYLSRVSDIFSIMQGIRTGNNKVFIIREEEYQDIPDTEKKYYKELYQSTSIKKYVWYPYDQKGLIFEGESDLKKNCKYIYKRFLLPNKNRLKERARKDKESWRHLSEHRAWLRNNSKKIISAEFGNSKSFSYDSKGDLLIERGNGWFLIKDENTNDNYYFYLSIFSSSYFDTLLSIYSRQLAGGKRYDLGSKFCGLIPLPKVYKKKTMECCILYDSEIYKQLVQIGIDISKSNFYDYHILNKLVKEEIYQDFTS